jgi:hypothetical protein
MKNLRCHTSIQFVNIISSILVELSLQSMQQTYKTKQTLKLHCVTTHAVFTADIFNLFLLSWYYSTCKILNNSAAMPAKTQVLTEKRECLLSVTCRTPYSDLTASPCGCCATIKVYWYLRQYGRQCREQTTDLIPGRGRALCLPNSVQASTGTHIASPSIGTEGSFTVFKRPGQESRGWGLLKILQSIAK